MAQRPAFPVRRTPNWGSATRREKNRVAGVWKKPAFSRKNGLRSGKNTSNRWLMVTCGSSDSTWLKSGFSARSSANASRNTIFESTPPRISPWLAKPAPDGDSVSRYCAFVDIP